MNLVRSVLFLVFLSLFSINSSYAATICYADFISSDATGFSGYAQYINSPTNFYPTGETYPSPNPASTSNDRVRLTVSDPGSSLADNKISMNYFYHQSYRALSVGSNKGCNYANQIHQISLASLRSGYSSSDLNGGTCQISFSGSTPSIPDLDSGQSYNTNLGFTSSLRTFTHTNGQVAHIPNSVRQSNYDMGAKVDIIIRSESSGSEVYRTSSNLVFAPQATKQLSLSIPTSLSAGDYEIFYKPDTTSEIKCQGKHGSSNEVLITSFKVNSAPQPPASCSLDGVNVPHGSSYSFFDSTSVPFGSTCNAQSRSCNDGTLSGSSSYRFSSCTVQASSNPPADCSLDGTNVPHGSSFSFFNTQSVPFGSTCQAQSRSCNNGTLSGSASYQYSTCTVDNPAPPANCQLNGVNVNHGSSYTFFSSTSVPYGQTCQSQNRACNDGSLSGSSAFKYPSCSVQNPDVTISSSQANVDLSQIIPGAATSPYVVLIQPGTVISSNNPNNPALTTGALPSNSDITIINKGKIQGAGGIGGNSVHTDSGQPGRKGGTAIELTVPTKISNEGQIYSGGGGGGAGGAGQYCDGIAFGICIGNTNYGAAGSGGGGAGLVPGQPGVQAVSDDNPPAASYATVGTPTAPGTGGAAGRDAGVGGSGGAPGQDGQPGQNGDFRTGGAGGPAGDAIVTNHNSLQWIGTGQGDMLGPVINSQSTATACSFRNQVIPPLSSLEFFKRPINSNDKTCEELRMEARCGYGGLHFINAQGISFSSYSGQAHPTCTDLPPDYHTGTNETETTDGNYTFEEDDNSTVAKVVVDPVRNITTFIDTKGTEVNLTLPTADPTKQIGVYKNGVLERQDLVDPRLIALKAHKVKKFTSKTQVEQFVDEVYDLMTKFTITKNLTYSNATNKTSVKIKLSDISADERLNLTIYKVVPKEEAATVDDIVFISDGGGERIVVDADPVIGWYFNESEGDEEIEYEVDGDGEGGSIIITYEPILYNEGELIFNYRETGCNVGEVALFELEDLEDSRIYPVGSGELYTVCASHLTQTLKNDSTGYLDQHLFLYDSFGNMSYDNSLYSSVVEMSTDNISKTYWDMKLQTDNPTGDYSCLGSIENSSNSLFGDCGYSLNRIWLHLGPDELAPETTAQYPFIGHTIKVTLAAQDNTGGSGVDTTYYCFDDENSCTPTDVYSEPVTVSCPYDWGCTKYMRFYTTDIDGNVESVQSQMLRLIDKGSACQESCVATPTPNRFLKECRNINNCEYKDLNGDGGETVAQRCDLLVEGSYVTYDSENDVLCPNGPLRKSRFTAFDLDIEETVCDNLLAIPYVGVLEGATVVLKILTCQDE